MLAHSRVRQDLATYFAEEMTRRCTGERKRKRKQVGMHGQVENVNRNVKQINEQPAKQARYMHKQGERER